MQNLGEVLRWGENLVVESAIFEIANSHFSVHSRAAMKINL